MAGRLRNPLRVHSELGMDRTRRYFGGFSGWSHLNQKKFHEHSEAKDANSFIEENVRPHTYQVRTRSRAEGSLVLRAKICATKSNVEGEIPPLGIAVCIQAAPSARHGFLLMKG